MLLISVEVVHVGVNLFLVYEKLDFTLGLTRSIVKIQLNAKRRS